MPTAASCDSCMRLLAGRLVDICCEVWGAGQCIPTKCIYGDNELFLWEFVDHSPSSCDLPHWALILLGHWSSTWEMPESFVARKWEYGSVNGCKHKSQIYTTEFLTSYRFGTNASQWSRIHWKKWARSGIILISHVILKTFCIELLHVRKKERKCIILPHLAISSTWSPLLIFSNISSLFPSELYEE